MSEEIINDIDKLDGMVKIKGKCGYEIIGGCSELRRLKQENEELKAKRIKSLGFICDCEENAKYKQALEEIREYCIKCKNCVETGDEIILYTIKKKCNKVLNG